jgi:hypothetical protein
MAEVDVDLGEDELAGIVADRANQVMAREGLGGELGKHEPLVGIENLVHPIVICHINNPRRV